MGQPEEGRYARLSQVTGKKHTEIEGAFSADAEKAEGMRKI